MQISTVNAKSVDPSQTSHSVASDLYLHCLQKDMLGRGDILVSVRIPLVLALALTSAA